MPKPDFHSNLSNIINDNYWTKKDYIRHNDARRALKEKVKKVDMMDVDGTPGVSIPVESDGTLKAISDFVFGPVRPPIDSKSISRCQENARLQVGAPAPRLVSGPKHKDDILT